MAAEKKIDGVLYKFEPLVGWEAFNAMDMALRVAAPFAGLLRAVGEADEAKRTDALALAIPDLLRGHDAAKVRELAEMLFEACRADGEAVVVGVKPQRLGEMMQLFAWCLEKQFGDFFGEAVAIFLQATKDGKTAGATAG